MTWMRAKFVIRTHECSFHIANRTHLCLSTQFPSPKKQTAQLAAKFVATKGLQVADGCGTQLSYYDTTMTL
jgi:hypothetical protein